MAEEINKKENKIYGKPAGFWAREKGPVPFYFKTGTIHGRVLL